MALFPQSKSNKIFWGVGLFFVAFFLFIVGYYYYDQWHGQKRVEELKQALENFGKEVLARKSADKIGGNTPQETLQMFIDAVEKGDYELASKYFVIENQEKEKIELKNIEEKNNLNWFINILKNAKPDGEIEGDYFRMKSKTEMGPYYFIKFYRYPSGNWKIEEI